jgi:parallel beta helix pectate lyase-like protein
MTKFVRILLIMLLIFIVSSVFAEDNVMFNYQGRVKVQGNEFNGTGFFKFSIVNKNGIKSLWSNDLSSLNGSEPEDSIPVTVNHGIFNVMIGSSELSMSPINRSVFNSPGDIFLRIWFSDGIHGFQPLLPDRTLLNIELLGLRTGKEDFTIFVNGTTGNDENSGLTTGTAKKTIQAAVDVLPESLLCYITIDVAPGVYREEILIKNFNPSSPDSGITISGNVENPEKVRITGSNLENDTEAVRENIISLVKASDVSIRGFLFDYCKESGVCGMESTFIIDKCVFRNIIKTASKAEHFSKITVNNSSFSECYSGTVATGNCMAFIDNCEFNDMTQYHGVGISKGSSGVIKNSNFTNSTGAGICTFENSRVSLQNCVIDGCGTGNYFFGIDVWDVSSCKIYESTIKNCTRGGVRARRNSFVQFFLTTGMEKSIVQSNNIGVQAEYLSGIENMGNIAVTVRGNNKDVHTAYNGYVYFIP